MSLPEIIQDLKKFFSSLFKENKGTVKIVQIMEDDVIAFEGFYSPSLYNNGLNSVKINGINLEPKQSLEWKDIPFAIVDYTAKIVFLPTGKPENNSIILSYGIKYTN